MKNFAIVTAIFAGCILFLGSCSALTVVNVLNNEAMDKNGIVAQEQIREAAYDKLWKKISQTTQITKASSELQKTLVEELIKGRPAGFIRVVNESNPDSAFTREQFNKLSNLVEGERESFFREQKMLISKVENYNNQYDTVLSGMVLKFAGRQRYPMPLIISSDISKNVIQTGKDNNVDLKL